MVVIITISINYQNNNDASEGMTIHIVCEVTDVFEWILVTNNQVRQLWSQFLTY